MLRECQREARPSKLWTANLRNCSSLPAFHSPLEHSRPRDDLRHGRSEQKRSDCPLVTLALSQDETGFPCHSEILPGNVSEPATLAAAIERLDALRGDRPLPTVVMDAGLSTQATLAWLREQGYDWISVRRGQQDPPVEAPELEFSTRKGTQARVWRLRRAEGERETEEERESEGESELCIWSEERQAKDEAILGQQRERFERELQALDAGLTKKGCTKRYDKVVERLGRLKERYRRVAGQYTLTVERAGPDTVASARGKSTTKGQGGGGAHQPERSTAVRFERNEQHARKDARTGTYVLRTSHTDWDLERIVRTYWQLTDIEATFRSLKSEIGLRPIWHTRKDRIRSHLFIAVLAYHGVHLLRRRLRDHGIHDSWTTIRHKLAGWERITTTLETNTGERIVCRQDSRPDPPAAGVTPGLYRIRSRTPAA